MDQGAASSLSFSLVLKAETLNDHSEHLEDLAAAAAEPNVFYEPWMLFPAIESYGRYKNLRFVMAYLSDPATGRALLCGFFPLERRSIPVRRIALWRYPHCFLGTPLVRAGFEESVLAGFFSWLETENQGAAFLTLGHISASGPVHSALQYALAHRSRLKSLSIASQRALFLRDKDAGYYFNAAFSNRKRKEFRRLARRLSEHGSVTFEALNPGDDVDCWVTEFLTLEASGWKGRTGTALAADPADRRYFRTITRQAFSRKRLSMLALRVDGRAIALNCNFLARDGGFAFKIAYDEAFQHYSPGMLLTLEHIRRMHEPDGMDWLDSCAVPDHFMANRLYTHRKPMRTLRVSTGHALGNTAVMVLALLRRVSHLRIGGN